MSALGVIAAATVAAAVWSCQSPAAAAGVGSVWPATDESRTPGGPAADPGSIASWTHSASARRATAALAALAALVTLSGPLGWALSLATAAAVERWLSTLPTRVVVAESAALRRQLPMSLELMGAALLSGATTVAAVELAADGAGAALSQRLTKVAASLRLGATAEEAWRPTLDDDALAPLGRVGIRSAMSGAAMAGAVRELAVRRREAQVVEAQVAIRRAGVLSVLPLALCFLPAFILVGIVPIVVGLLRSLAL